MKLVKYERSISLNDVKVCLDLKSDTNVKFAKDLLDTTVRKELEAGRSGFLIRTRAGLFYLDFERGDKQVDEVLYEYSYAYHDITKELGLTISKSVKDSLNGKHINLNKINEAAKQFGLSDDLPDVDSFKFKK